MMDLYWGLDGFEESTVSKDMSTKPSDKKEIKMLFLPLCSSSVIMEDKSFPMRLYGKLTLESNYNLVKKEEHRYVYNSKLRTESFRNDLKEMNISIPTFNRQMKKLREYDELIEMHETQEGVVYKLHYRNPGCGEFVCIREDVLCRILKETNDTAFKIYLILLYALRDNENNCYIEKQITREWLLGRLGLKPTSRQCITDALKQLDGRYIKVRKETKQRDTINKNNTITVTTITQNYISLIEQELHAPIFIRKIGSYFDSGISAFSIEAL